MRTLLAMIRLKRAYDPPAPQDGVRVLVDRLWPRGVKRDSAQLSRWMKEIGPSDQLRQFFGHEPERFEEFRRRYLKELSLASAKPQLDELLALARRETLTLVYGAKDPLHNQAVVLKGLLESRLKRQKG